METPDWLRRQQELHDKLYPKHLREIFNRMPVYKSPLDAIIKKIEIFNIDNRPSYLKEMAKINKMFERPEWYNSITNNAALTAYSKQLAVLDSAINQFTKGIKFDYALQNLSYANYDFIELNTEQFEYTNTEQKEESRLIILNETKSIQYILNDIYYKNGNLFNVLPREFEKIVAELMSHQGYDVELTKQTRDGGYDLIAIKKLGLFSPLKFLVECKRYKTQKIGVGIIRAFKEVIVTEQANRGIIVTTSYFSKDAIKKQKETPYLLDYRDKDQLMEWIKDYCETKNS